MKVKALIEKKNTILEKLESMLKKAEVETRALNDDEIKEYETAKAEIKNLDMTIRAMQEQIDNNVKKDDETGTDKLTVEERSFVETVRGIKAETRTDSNFTKTANSAVIPTTIIDKIISKVKEISPLYNMATKYTVNGNITIPYIDTADGDVKMAWANEFTELESSSMKFKSIDLSGHLAGVLCKVSKSLLNNSDFDLLSYIISYMAESISAWIEKVLIDDEAGKLEGMKGVKQKAEIPETGITADDLIDIQESIPDVYQSSAVWIMNKSTRKAIRKFKDKDGQYLLNRDVSEKWNYTLLGKSVYISENMPELSEKGKNVIYYGDMSGLAVKLGEGASLEVLREKYATQHCVGVNAWIEIDSKIENAQKISALVTKSNSAG